MIHEAARQRAKWDRQGTSVAIRSRPAEDPARLDDDPEWTSLQRLAASAAQGPEVSQRHLAHRSGVDHSTISRLIQGDRIPSLGTAKLAHGLRELSHDADTLEYLGLMSSREPDPSARIESALRSDDVLSEMQVRQIREY